MSTTNKRGLFISFEGTEGSGKSTQVRLLVERLRREGYAVTENQEPGRTVIGKQIRQILLDPAHTEIAPITELLLMFASRTQAAAEIISPSLLRGEVVVSDRFTDSTLAYQGEARGLGFDKVLAVHRLALDSLLPDLTFCIDIDVEEGLARARRRNAETSTDDRLDHQSLAFHQVVRRGYAKIGELEPNRFKIVDGRAGSDVVAERVWNYVKQKLP